MNAARIPTLPFREGYAIGRRGVRLYYRIEGSGPALLCSNGIGVSTFFWGPVARNLADSYRIIRWDYRGHGFSDEPVSPDEASLSLCADDALAVLDDVGVESAVLVGHSMGSQVGFEVFRKAPRRVAGLIPTLGTYRRAIESFLGTHHSLKGFEVIRRVIPRAPKAIQKAVGLTMDPRIADPAARLMHLVHPELAPKEELIPYFRHNRRVDLRMYLKLAESMQAHDATALLPTIDVPTLVVAGDKDLFTPLSCAQEMAQAIPDAELFVIPGGTHAALIEQPLLLALRIRKFLEERLTHSDSRWTRR